MLQRRHCLLAGLATGALALSEARALTAPNTGTTVRLVVGEWAPYFSPALPQLGLFAQIVSEAFGRVGLAVEYVQVPWKRALVDVEAGLLHGSPGWALNEERALKFLYSDPVIISRDALFFLKRRPLVYERDDDLRGKQLGATAGYHYGAAVHHMEAEQALKLDRAPTDEASMRKLLLGRVDAVLMNRVAGLHLLRNKFTPAERALISVSDKFITAKTSHLLMTRKLPEGAIMLQAFDRGLAALSREGRVQQILPADGPGHAAAIPAPKTKGAHREQRAP